MNKRIVALNTYSSGSTGTIMQGIARKAAENGYEYKMFVGFGARPLFEGANIAAINTRRGARVAELLSKLTGLEGRFARRATRKLIKNIKAENPSVIHLHNLHYSYVNLPMLFRFIKKSGIPVVWTLHDCWAFTGHCPHFTYQKCEKWKDGCHGCPRYNLYPRSLYDNSKFLWRWKKKWFSGLQNLTIVTPCEWMNTPLKESFLKDYPIVTVYNGIDLDAFKPTKGDFREKHGIGKEEKLVLGVSSVWNERKGLDVFTDLAAKLPKNYRIALVGLDSATAAKLPENITALGRIEGVSELAGAYSAADLFLNPTREDTFPTVNLEALACGIPVVTFKAGGSAECLDKTCGRAVECDDIAALIGAVTEICEQKPFSADSCRKRADVFKAETQFEKYLEIYKSVAQKE